MDEKVFSVSLTESEVQIRTLNTTNSIFIWIGNHTATFNNLVLGSCTKFSKVPSRVDLLGKSSETLVQKLCKRLGKQVLLSYNVQSDTLEQSMIEDLILKEVIKNLKEH